jgi:hypothetical protein
LTWRFCQGIERPLSDRAALGLADSFALRKEVIKVLSDRYGLTEVAAP